MLSLSAIYIVHYIKNIMTQNENVLNDQFQQVNLNKFLAKHNKLIPKENKVWNQP